VRRAAATDANQAEIVRVLRDFCTVELLSAVGGGVPDLLAGFRGVNVLLEVKDGSKTPSRRVLTRDQKVWHSSWAGQVAVVNDVAEAVATVMRLTRPRGE